MWLGSVLYSRYPTYCKSSSLSSFTATWTFTSKMDSHGEKRTKQCSTSYAHLFYSILVPARVRECVRIRPMSLKPFLWWFKPDEAPNSSLGHSRCMLFSRQVLGVKFINLTDGNNFLTLHVPNLLKICLLSTENFKGLWQGMCFHFLSLVHGSP